MTHFFRKTLVDTSVAVATTLTIAGSSFAVESSATVIVNALGNNDTFVELAQVTSVSELSDVLPSDWAYTALQRLVEEYGCIEGYPDRTFRGNRAMSRYEFAAGLNACLDVIVQLINSDNASGLDSIRRLQEEFAAELATVRGLVDTLEADVAELEANQFSTTKLRGQLDAHLVVPFDAPVGANETTFEYSASLNFDTSFTGEDRLRIRLQASDAAGAAAGAGGLANVSAPSNGIADNIKLDDVYYAFPVGERLSVTLAANSMNADDFVTSTIVPFDGVAVGDFSGPVFYDAYFTGESLGLGVNFALTESLILDLGYATNEGNDPSVGIFDQYEYIVQLNYLSDGLIDAAITYMDAEFIDPASGLSIGPDSIIAGLLNLDFGGFQLGGHYAFVDGIDDVTGIAFANSWQIGAAFPSFLGTDHEFGLYAGENLFSTFIAEGYYEIGINDFLTITPAVLYGDPNVASTSSEVYGVIRTTFRF